jgi:hypothetical protein
MSCEGKKCRQAGRVRPGCASRALPDREGRVRQTRAGRFGAGQPDAMTMDLVDDPTDLLRMLRRTATRTAVKAALGVSIIWVTGRY